MAPSFLACIAKMADVEEVVRRRGGVVVVPTKTAPALRRHLHIVGEVSRCTHVVGLAQRRQFKTAPHTRFRNGLACPKAMLPAWSVGWEAGAMLIRSGRHWTPIPTKTLAVTSGW
jgi:hypothetical protein